MKQKIVFLLFGFILTLALPSCIKDEVIPLGDGGNTIIKFIDGPELKLFFNPFEDVKEIHLFTFRRDANSAAELDKAADVVVQISTDKVDAYNTDNDATFEYLPEDIFEFAPDAGVTRNGDQFTIHFEPGEFSKDMNILLDGSLWDLSKKFAIAFEVVDNGGYQVSTDYGTMFTAISIKNKWDGIYEVTEGTMVDVVNGTLTHSNEILNYWTEGDKMQWTLRTISATECEVYDGYFFNDGTMRMPITSGGTSYSSYGFFAIVVKFDPETDAVVDVYNSYGVQAGSNKRSGRLDPTGINTYDNGVVKIKYNMIQEANAPSLVAPYVRTTWTETWTFLKDRE